MPAPTAAAVLACLVLPLAGCASGGKKTRADTQYVARDVNTLYNLAKKRLDQRQYAVAAAVFDEVERQHPYSVWARRAQLMSAFSYYAAQGLYQVDRIRAPLPVDPSRQPGRALRLLSDRAQLLRADQGRDPRPEHDPQALDALGELVRRYPDTRYAADARLKIDLVRDHLAGKEMEIGRFYQRRGQWLASVLRFRTVIDEYQTTSHTPEALMRLTESYLALGIPEEARQSAAVLGANYPSTKWYERAYSLVQKHAPASQPLRRRRDAVRHPGESRDLVTERHGR